LHEYAFPVIFVERSLRKNILTGRYGLLNGHISFKGNVKWFHSHSHQE